MTSLLRPRPPPLLRLLADHPEPQRTQLFDHPFKSGYSAALQTLKLKVGGDTNSERAKARTGAEN